MLLDLRKLSSVTDYFVICGSRSLVGVRAIAEAILEQLKQEGSVANHIEGMQAGTWVLADYGDVVVHVFFEQVRKYYDLESLWGDAPRRSFKPRQKTETKGGRRRTKG